MSYLKLIKLLYLADRKALITWGRPITTDRYISMDKGPVLSRIRDLITEDQERGLAWRAHISEPLPNYEVELISSPGDDELSTAEIDMLNAIFDEFGSMSRWELVKVAHALPEWEYPDGSSIPITYRDILNAGGKTEVEIAAIERELAEVTRADELLAGS